MKQVIVYTSNEPELVKEMLIKCPERLSVLVDNDEKPTGQYKLKASKIPTQRKDTHSVSLLVIEASDWVVNLDNAEILAQGDRDKREDPHDNLTADGYLKINKCRVNSYIDDEGETVELDEKRPIGAMSY
tara:strand:+ start:121 stop:510 length:390 start_codon:yes stop_codon:yes gene_type:complete